MIRVTIWHEYRHEKTKPEVAALYPNGMHAFIRDFLRSDDISVRLAALDDENFGVTQEMLDETDVLIWWSHGTWRLLPDEKAAMVRDAVLRGMGAIFLHSAHNSKPFKMLTGTANTLTWRKGGDRERLWVVDPSHPITQGIGTYIDLEHEEVYCEPFKIPDPDKLLFIGVFEGGEAFRAGCCYQRGNGKIFYFQPGHETYASYGHKDVQTVIRNAVYWANPIYREKALDGGVHREMDDAYRPIAQR